jgi:histidinol-phosphate aminotransferase
MGMQKRSAAAQKNKRLPAKRVGGSHKRTGDSAKSAARGWSRTGGGAKSRFRRTESSPNGAAGTVLAPDIRNALASVKSEIRNAAGYVAPPQGNFRAKLNQNENPYDVPDAVKQEILYDMRSFEWTRYPDYNPPAVREALSKTLSIRPDQILLAGGSNVLLYMIGLAVLAPGDSLLLTPPTFGLFELIGRFYNARVIRADQRPGFSYDTKKMIASARKAKLTFLCSPNNPVGNTIPLETLEELLKATRGLVVWDEAYAEFCGRTALPLLEKYPHLLVLRTFSKAFGLAGLRLGYLMGRPELITEFSKVNIPYNVNLFTEAAALRLLGGTAWYREGVQRIVQERDRLFRELDAVGRVTAFPSEANFILIRVPDAKAVFEALKTRGVLLRMINGHPLLKNCLRATVGTPEENQIFIEALKDVLNKM